MRSLALSNAGILRVNSSVPTLDLNRDLKEEGYAKLIKILDLNIDLECTYNLAKKDKGMQ